MPDLPRVTYSNTAGDFTGLHNWLDTEIPALKARLLGRDWSNRVAGRANADGAVYAAPSPVDTDVVLGRFVEASPAAVIAAISAAQAAYPAWSRRPWQERVAVLRRFAEVLRRRKYELGIACLLEVGKSRMEALGEAEECVDLVDYYCDEMERHQGFDRPMSRAFPNEETRDLLRPLGVFGVIAPFNFPTALSVGMLTGALLTGNTAVYKPSPMAGLTGALLVECFAEAGLPEGALNLVCGGEAVGRALIADPRLAGAAFTGSHKVGMEIFRAFASGPHARPVVVEMGGKNPAYVAASADLDVAAAGVMRSAFGLQGQKCSACSKAYVHAKVFDAFMERLLGLTAKIKIGNPEARDVYLGPVIDARAVARFEAAATSARRDGRILAGGQRLTTGDLAKGHFVAPTIVAELPPEHPIHKDELFLPFLAVQRFTDLEAAIIDGNRVNYGLTAGVYAQDPAEVDRFLNGAEAGVLYVNRPSGATTGAWPGVQGFCGWKGTGVSGKGGLGPHYIQQFMREQSQTVWHPPSAG